MVCPWDHLKLILTQTPDYTFTIPPQKFLKDQRPNDGKLDPAMFLKHGLSEPKIRLKKDDFSYDFQNTWEEPIQPTESTILYQIALFLAHTWDKVYYDLCGREKPPAINKCKHSMLHNGEWVQYRNEFLLDRKVPTTNLRILASRKVS